MFRPPSLAHFHNNIKMATKYLHFFQVVVPAKAGIQGISGCRIRSGMTSYLVAEIIINPSTSQPLSCHHPALTKFMPLAFLTFSIPNNSGHAPDICQAHSLPGRIWSIWSI
jgi:hypothetical protein